MMLESRLFLIVDPLPDGGSRVQVSLHKPELKPSRTVLRSRGTVPFDGVAFNIPATPQPYTPPRQMTVRGVTGSNGRVILTFDPPFPAVPTVSAPKLMYLAASGCTVFQVGDATKSSVTFEVRKMKTLVAGLVGIAHEPASGVTVEINVSA